MIAALAAAWSWLANSRAAQWALAIGAGFLVLWRAVAGIKQAGRQEEQAAALRQNAENSNARLEVDRNVAREPDPVGRLRADWSRD